jgi:hypothetical protein
MGPTCDDGRVLEPPEERPYPPDSIWRFPPPPVSRLWLVAAIVAGILGLTTVGGAFTYLALNGERDIPGFIDDERVLATAIRECRLMTSTVRGLGADGRPEDWMDTLSDQNTAVKNMVDRIRSLGSKVRESDQPLDAWLADWEKLVSGRETYLGQRRRGEVNEFRVPRSPDGDPINVRMDMAGEDVCAVPDVLLNPDLAGTRPI